MCLAYLASHCHSVLFSFVLKMYCNVSLSLFRDIHCALARFHTLDLDSLPLVDSNGRPAKFDRTNKLMKWIDMFITMIPDRILVEVPHKKEKYESGVFFFFIKGPVVISCNIKHHLLYF